MCQTQVRHRGEDVADRQLNFIFPVLLAAFYCLFIAYLIQHAVKYLYFVFVGRQYRLPVLHLKMHDLVTSNGRCASPLGPIFTNDSSFESLDNGLFGDMGLRSFFGKAHETLTN